MPWWAVLPFMLLGCYWYAPWFEAAVIAIFFDLVFGVARTSFHGFQGMYAASAVLMIVLMYFIKKRFINV
jgi:hypothetical protein